MMPVIRIDALCECEGCAKRFGVELDVAADRDDYRDFDHLVRETILGGLAPTYTWGVRGKATVDRLPLAYWPTIQAGYMLCDVCSEKCDNVPGIPETEGLTKEQVESTLGIGEGNDNT